jgi:hypothetical protein
MAVTSTITRADTLNLAGRAALAINAMASLRDERLGGLMYFTARYDEDPPTAYHDPWDYGDGTGRCVDALVLAHVMTASEQALSVAQEMGEALIAWQGEMGLSWWPEAPETLPGITNDMKRLRDWKPEERVAEIGMTQRGTLMGLTSLYLLTGDEHYRRHAQALVDGLNQVALGDSSYRFMPEIAYRPGGWRYTSEPVSDGTSEWSAATVLPLLRFYEATGYQPSLDLAGGLIRFILHRAEGFDLDGSFHKTQGFWSHFHSKVAVISGIIRYGLTTCQPEYVAWGRQAYDAAKRWGTDFGWFPEDITNLRRCETCGITDMLEAAIMLGLHVAPGYLDDAECYGRNHLVESQFLGTDWATRIPRRRFDRTQVMGARRWCDRDIVSRSTGSFAGWSAPNDLFEASRFQLMACCNAAGTRALYDLWHCATDDDGHHCRVHMAFSRPTAWGDVVGYQPFAGRLDVHMKVPRSLSVRIPGWAAWSEVQVSVNDQPAQYERQGAYARLPQLQAGDVVSVRYPLPIESRTYRLGDDMGVATYKGATAVNITPGGTFWPLYRRDHYLGSEPPQAEQLWHLPAREITSGL